GRPVQKAHRNWPYAWPMAKPQTALQTLQRVFLWTIIVSFSLSALYGIAVLLGANADTIGSQVVASTLLVGSYSLAMLCGGSAFNKPERALGVVGVVISAFSMLWSLWLVWSEPTMPHTAAEILFSGITLTTACTFASLLLAATNYRDTLLRALLGATLVSVAITVGMVLLSIWNTPAINIPYFGRALGIVLILAVVTGIITPILSVLRRKADQTSAPVPADEQANGPYRLDAVTAAALEAEARRQGVSVAQLVTTVLGTRQTSESDEH